MKSNESYIRNILINRDAKILINIAEDIGNYLRMGMIRTNQTSKIFRLVDNALHDLILNKNKKEKENLDQKILLLKPKIAYIISKTSFRERSALERFIDAINDGIDCIFEVEGEEKFERIKTFRNFLEAIIEYQHYAITTGSRVQIDQEETKLRDKITTMQLEMNELKQFISASIKNIKVFLSHSHSDKQFVERLKSDLEKNKITTWYDNKDMDIGDIVSDAISIGIKQSWCFLIVVSPFSIKSNWVKYELDEAYESHISEGKKILPILTGDITDNDIPKRLKKHLFADFRDESKYDETFEKLLRSIVREGAKKIDK